MWIVWHLLTSCVHPPSAQAWHLSRASTWKMQVYMESRWKLQRHVQYIEGCRNVELLTSISSPLCNSFSLILWDPSRLWQLAKIHPVPNMLPPHQAHGCRVPKFTQACRLASCFKTSSSAMMRQASRGSMASGKVQNSNTWWVACWQVVAQRNILAQPQTWDAKQFRRFIYVLSNRITIITPLTTCSNQHRNVLVENINDSPLGTENCEPAQRLPFAKLSCVSSSALSN